MSQTKDPCDKIELTWEQEEELKQRIESNNLSEHDKKIIIGLIAFNRWLQVSLSNAKITIVNGGVKARINGEAKF